MLVFFCCGGRGAYRGEVACGAVDGWMFELALEVAVGRTWSRNVARVYRRAFDRRAGFSIPDERHAHCGGVDYCKIGDGLWVAFSSVNFVVLERTWEETAAWGFRRVWSRSCLFLAATRRARSFSSRSRSETELPRASCQSVDGRVQVVDLSG